MAGDRQNDNRAFGKIFRLPTQRKTHLTLTFLEFSHALVLMLWVGSLAGFALVVFPTILSTLPNLEMVIQAFLAIFERTAYLGCGAGAFLLLTTLIMDLLSLRERRVVLIQAGLLLVMILSAISGQLFLAPRISGQLASLTEPLSSLANDDPARLALERLHGIGLVLLGAQVVSGMAIIGFAIRRWYRYIPARQEHVLSRDFSDPRLR